jgi:uncharacterized protein
MTGIHPESYAAARAILEKLGFSSSDLGKAELVEKVKAITPEESKALQEELNIGEYTIKDILDAFCSPLRDPRDVIEAPILKSDILHLEDLKVGMELQGTVRNVTDFGAFVDCGLHDDGLVHISKMSTGFIKHPLDAVHVGQIVRVWVLEVDLKKERLQLTMIDPEAPKQAPKPAPREANNKKPRPKEPRQDVKRTGQKPQNKRKKMPELPFAVKERPHLGRK